MSIKEPAFRLLRLAWEGAALEGPCSKLRRLAEMVLYYFDRQGGESPH